MKIGFTFIVVSVLVFAIELSGTATVASAAAIQGSDNESAETESKNNDTTGGEGEQSDKAIEKEVSRGKQDESEKEAVIKPEIKTATFGGGCFWCVEAVFVRLKGVEKVRSGFMGGTVPNPTYKDVLTGVTGHAEVIQIEYDANQISYDELLEVFWKTHDPTTLNQQGNDIGTQYRSVVFYHDEEQKELAETYKKKLNEEKVFRRPVVTELSAAAEFYVAEDYHQDFYKNNPSNAYCRAVIPKKLQKLNQVFKDKLKVETKPRAGKKTEPGK